MFIAIRVCLSIRLAKNFVDLRKVAGLNVSFGNIFFFAEIFFERSDL